MVQVENEYGFFGKDAEYMGALRAGAASTAVSTCRCSPAIRRLISRTVIGRTFSRW